MSSPCRLHLVGHRAEVRIVLERDRDRLVRRARQARQRGRRVEIVRQLADDAAEAFLAGAQPALRGGERALRQRQPRFGLGDVGTGQVAHLEPVARRLQIGLQHPHLILIQGDDGAVANHVHVGADRFGEDVAFGPAQVGAAGLDPRVGGADLVAHAAGVEQRIGDVHSEAEIAAFAGIGVEQILVQPGIGRHIGSQPRARDRHGLVEHTQPLALRHQRRVRAIGALQRLPQRLRGRIAARQQCRRPRRSQQPHPLHVHNHPFRN
jgi:hypothetical protein